MDFLGANVPSTAENLGAVHRRKNERCTKYIVCEGICKGELGKEGRQRACSVEIRFTG